MCSILCYVEADTSALCSTLQPQTGAGGMEFYEIKYDVVITLGLTELKAHVCWENEQVSCIQYSSG